MKGTVLHVLFSIFWLYSFESTNCQFRNLKFKTLSTENGLSNSRPLCLLHDSKGYLWIGTQNGLNRFDGTSVKSFSKDLSKANSISDDLITCIYEDRFNNLWIGTSAGLNKFDRKTETFTKFISDNFNTSSISNNWVNSIMEDKKGSLWVSCQDGLNKWINEKQSFIRYKVPYNQSKLLENYYFDKLGIDADGNIWGACGVVLWRFNTNTNKYESFRNDDIIGSSFNERNSIVIDKTGVVWVGTRANGLISYNPKLGKFKRFAISDDGRGTNSKVIMDICLGNDNYLYLATWNAGINRLDLNSNAIEYCTVNDSKINSLCSNSIISIYKDSEGILYAGSESSGISINNPKTYKFDVFQKNPNDKYSLVDKVVLVVFQDSYGLIWIGTLDGGISIFNPTTNIFTNYSHNSNDPYSISDNYIIGIDEDRNHDIWIGTNFEGLNRFERKSGKFKHYLPNASNPNAISYKEVLGLKFDINGYLWLTYFPTGMDMFDIDKGVVKKFRNNPHNPNSIPKTFIDLIVPVNSNELGLITPIGYWLFNVNNHSFTKYEPLDSVHLIDVYTDSHNNKWFATFREGLWMIDTTGKIEKHNTANGFISNSISGMLEDNNGNLWISTDKGLSRYNLLDKTFRYFDIADGLPTSNFKVYCREKANNGLFYFGTGSGLVTFNPDSIKINKYIPSVYINEFQIFNELITPNSPNSPLTQTIEETKEIVISYKESIFSFGFIAINYTFPEKSIFAYKLEGFEKKWNYTTYKRRFVTYTNLDPGVYTFMVKATNNDQVWNETPTTIKITIIPPFWETWWFRVGIILIITLSVFVWYNLKVTSLKKNALTLENLVKIRTIELSETNQVLEEQKEELEEQKEELEQQKEEVKAQRDEVLVLNDVLAKQTNEIQAQNYELHIHRNNLEILVQNRTGELEIARHKAEESDQLKSSFLANMSHEIRTPLNAIVGFSSLLNDGALTSEKLDTYITIIQSNSESLLNLIDDILDLAKIEAGQIEINVLPIKISSFLQQVFETFSKINLKNDIKIILTLPDSTNEYYVIADPFRLNQIFNNLLSNALKFTDLGTIEIGVKPIVNELVTVYVKDTGIGIASENKLAIFDRFRKIETDTHNLYRGTGLGLSIVARLVEMMGGSIWVESELNIGSTFYFTMPVMLQTPNAEKTTEAFTSDILGISIDKILIVEDIEVNYLYLVALLKDFNATMLWAKNGDEAIDIARNNNYISVILMDIKLPGINGTETMHEIRKFNSTVPIIAQTAFALNEEKESFLKDGFNGYISKPIRKTELFEVLRHCLKIL